MWVLHRRTLQRGILPTVPATVLGQCWRGGSTPRLSRLLSGCLIEDLTDVGARAAGELLAAAGSSDLVDASVVSGALARRDVVVTSDRSDLEALASGGSRRLAVIDV